MRMFCVLFLCLCGLPLLGCGSGRSDAPPRVRVSGMIRFDGEPLEQGEVRFLPTDDALPSSGAAIVNGRYEVLNKGGVPVGNHRVEIRGFRPRHGAEAAAPGIGAGEGEVPTEQYIPSQYNEHSTLTLTIEDSRVSLEKNFDLTP